MPELFWLLLPVAAFSGWYAARRHYLSSQISSANNPLLTQSYYRGLNYLLTDQPDKAVDIFTEMLEVNSDTVELHLALGHLFRRQGQTDRAIRLHQNLIARPTLAIEQRDQVMLELGQDYLKAGLLDRAERIFKDLSQSKTYGKQAQKFLIDVYQLEKDWEAAIQISRQFEKSAATDCSENISQFFCELAEAAVSKSQYDLARKYLKKALGVYPANVRASLIQAKIAMNERNYKNAIKYLMRVPQQDASYLNEIIEPLSECMDKIGESAGVIKRIENLLPKSIAATKASAFAELLQRTRDSESALEYLEEHLESASSLSVIKRYLAIAMHQVSQEEKPVLQRVIQMIEHLSQKVGDYQCSRCGFSGNTLHWQCPSCKTWGSIKPA